MISKTETEKLEFIDTVDTAINLIIETILKEHMKAYRERFGDFSRIDACLWGRCNIDYTVAYHAAVEMNADEE